MQTLKKVSIGEITRSLLKLKRFLRKSPHFIRTIGLLLFERSEKFDTIKSWVGFGNGSFILSNVRTDSTTRGLLGIFQQEWNNTEAVKEVNLQQSTDLNVFAMLKNLLTCFRREKENINLRILAGRKKRSYFADARYQYSSNGVRSESAARSHNRFKFSALPRTIISVLLISSLILQNLIFNISPVYAASSPWTQTDWSGGSGQTNWLDATKFNASSSVATSTVGQVTLSPTSSWYNASWAYRRKITLNNSAQAENLTNFPVLVNLNSTRINYANTQNSGQDIRFTDSNGTTLLSYEIEKWDETGSSFVWVKVPQIDASSNTDYIYMYYGNSSATDGQAASSVWDSNYKLVQHLKETSGTTTADSTSNGFNGTKVSATEPNPTTSGKIDGAQTFDGTNDYISISDSDNWAFSGNFTITTWVNFNALSGNYWEHAMVGHDEGGGGTKKWFFTYDIGATKTTVFEHCTGGTCTNIRGNVWTASTGTWYLLTITRSGNTFTFYRNGASDGTATSSIAIPNPSTTLNLGFAEGDYLEGLLDEVRISNTARSAAWIGASYKSEADTFNTFASEEGNTQSSGTLTSSIFDTEFTGGAAWGTLAYSATTPSNTSVSVKARTSNSSSMSGATAFSSCTAITSGSDISSNSCVTDSHRYIQHELTLSNTNSISTPTFQDVSTTFAVYDTNAPSISLTALSPDPNNDNTPSLSGSATDAAGTVSNVQFQMDLTSGLWSSCTVSDGSFNSVSEAFSCSASTLSDGSHTMYVRATDSNGNTTSSSYASDTFTIDATNPSVSLTALSPDPNNDNTPTLSGTATESSGIVSNVQFQVDSTSGTWSNCTASDGSFNAASENFTCTTSALLDGSHTIYVRATDNAANNSSNTSDSFTVDTTNPASFDLDSPGHDSYTNSERPSFKWKTSSDATAGLSKYVLEIDNPSIGSGQPSGDFTIDSIPTSRTTDYETNKYVVHYENFSDSDSTNNYISVYTKSHSDWGSAENDGKLREGRVAWKVKAVDNAGNETSSSSSLLIDRTNPKVELSQINSTPFSTSSNSNFSTTDKTPTISGKITDSLAGGDSLQTQDENGPKIASGPKQVDIKVEKKEGLTYKLITLYTINMDKPWYVCDNKEVSNNSKQKCDKYLPFEYTSQENLELGTYKITLTGKDKADNSSSEVTLTLNITTLFPITTPEEKNLPEEATKTLKPAAKQRIKEELEIAKPPAVPQPDVVQPAGEKVVEASQSTTQGKGNLMTTVLTKIGHGVKFVFNGISTGLAFVFDKTGQGLAFVGDKIGQGYNTIVDNSPGVIKTVLVSIENGATSISNSIGTGINKTKEGIANIAFAIGEKTQGVAGDFSLALIKFAYNFVSEPTKISDVKVAVLSPTSVKVSWITNHPANGKVNYGLDRTYPFDVQSEKRVTHHEFTLTDLKPDTLYYFEAMSNNKNYVYDANREFRTPPTK